MSRAEQVQRELERLTVEQLWEANKAHRGAVYNRVIGTVPGEHHDWEVDVTIYPLLFGRFRVCVGPCGKDDDGGFDWYADFDTFEEAHAEAEAFTPRQAQVLRTTPRSQAPPPRFS